MRFRQNFNIRRMLKVIMLQMAKSCVRRKNLPFVLLFLFLMWYCCSEFRSQEFANVTTRRWNRNLTHLVKKARLIIEPSATPCPLIEDIYVIVLVASAPHHTQQREAVRKTWGKHQRTYFVLGLHRNFKDKSSTQYVFRDNQMEAKRYDDLIIFGFRDAYQNLTLKTALMLHWTKARCPQAHFMLKTDDDVLINPWTMKTVLRENSDAQLLGFLYKNKVLDRDGHQRYYAPQYLAGNAYFIRVKYIPEILRKATELALFSLEDVYFTYMIAHKGLGLSLRHDWRLNPKRPWLNNSCAYWNLASSHSFSPQDMVTTWSRIESMKDNNSECSVFTAFLLINNWFLV